MDNLLTIQQVADYLGVSTHTVRGYVLYKKVPYIKVGSCVRFEKADICNFTLANKVQPLIIPKEVIE
ncbi:MAG: helix-turn-helix domain-containing protein [Sphaerochaetaceae bacterium]|nr:helix-turn-helix domain-containing protein [Sphaerochaetaceae bacterium]